MKRARPVLRYHGGKYLLADWIISHFPPHRIYTEAFGGAASVLMRKARSYAEVYNDLDGEVVSLFRVLRDPLTALRLRELLTLTPFSRAEFGLSYETSPDPVEQARRTICRAFMGFGSASHNSNHATGFRANSNRRGTTPAHDWSDYPDSVMRFCDRLRGVVIEQRPAAEILTAHDSPDTLHYVDPPYVTETRGKRQAGNYRHEMTDNNHADLATTLHGLQGGVILSGYPCPLYNEMYGGWRRVQLKTFADGAAPRTECLWLNPCACELSPQTEILSEAI